MLLSISNEYYDLSENKGAVLEGAFLDWTEIDEGSQNGKMVLEGAVLEEAFLDGAEIYSS